jgi:hypothetical protein
MYIGDTQPNGDSFYNFAIPGRLDSVEIYNNIVDSTDWDGIQLSCAKNGAKIHDNTVTHYGLANLGSQRTGIIMGGDTNGDIYNNTIKFGTGNGILVVGYGFIKVHDNTIEAAGYTDATGEQSILFGDFISTVETNALQIDSVYANTIIHPKVGLGVLRANNNNGQIQRVSYVNNQFCFSATPPVGWETTYLMSDATTTIRSGITVGLPTNSVTLVGTASQDLDGTISTYLWEKMSGPTGGTIGSPNSSITNVSSLTQGTYVYRLTVTDNLGATGTDSITIIVAPAFTRQFKQTLSMKIIK